jgi:hypothetical protein
MKSITLFSIMAITGLFLLACKPKVNVETTSMEGTTDEFAYDSTLAAQLGADEYGMRKYVMAFLKAGT